MTRAMDPSTVDHKASTLFERIIHMGNGSTIVRRMPCLPESGDLVRATKLEQLMFAVLSDDRTGVSGSC